MLFSACNLRQKGTVACVQPTYLLCTTACVHMECQTVPLCQVEITSCKHIMRRTANLLLRSAVGQQLQANVTFKQMTVGETKAHAAEGS